MNLVYEPVLPARQLQGTLIQTIKLLEAKRVIGIARWQAADRGVVQMLEMEIDPSHRRQGVGERLLHAVVGQAQSHFQAAPHPLRRIWMAVRQKTQVGGRVFLTDQGFHHVATITHLYLDEDLLIYSKAFV